MNVNPLPGSRSVFVDGISARQAAMEQGTEPLTEKGRPRTSGIDPDTRS